jgi:hypothetical protein
LKFIFLSVIYFTSNYFMEEKGSLKFLLLVFLAATCAYLFASALKKGIEHHQANGGFGQKASPRGQAAADTAKVAVQQAANAAPGTPAAIGAANTAIAAVGAAAAAPVVS